MKKKENVEVEVFDTKVEMSEAAADFILSTALKAVSVYGRFTIALSGGSTPKILYAMLATDEYASVMPWADTYIFWSDERNLPAGHEDYNGTLATKALLDHVQIPEKNIYPVPTHLSPAEAAAGYEQEILDFFEGEPVFDIILLGLGDDGHTASLFPGTDVLNEEERLVKETTVDAKVSERITFTYPLINEADNVLFLVSGASKADILSDIINGTGDKYPAQGVAPANGTLHWYLDKDAASKLK